MVVVLAVLEVGLEFVVEMVKVMVLVDMVVVVEVVVLVDVVVVVDGVVPPPLPPSPPPPPPLPILLQHLHPPQIHHLRGGYKLQFVEANLEATNLSTAQLLLLLLLPRPDKPVLRLVLPKRWIRAVRSGGSETRERQRP